MFDKEVGPIEAFIASIFGSIYGEWASKEIEKQIITLEEELDNAER